MVAEQRFQVSGAMQDAHDAKGIGRRVVYNQIREHSPEPDRFVGEVPASVSGSGIGGEEPEPPANLAEDMPGGACAALGQQILLNVV